MEILLILLASAGLTQILMYGTILNYPRSLITKINFFKELLNCSLCTSFWTGVLFSSLFFYNAGPLWVCLALPFACAGFGFLFDHLLEVLLKIAPKE